MVVIERADGTPGHVLNAENVNGTIWLYEVYSGQAAPVAGQMPGVVAIEAFYPLGDIAPSGGYSIIVVGPYNLLAGTPRPTGRGMPMEDF